jgi:enolase-phosphatase E1
MTTCDSTRAILLDVEGTTAPIDFVYSVLFPYARREFEAFLSDRWDDPEVRAAVTDLEAVRHNDDPSAPRVRDHSGITSPAAVAAYARWLMDRDRKTTPLKALQGLIWERGYEAGIVTAQIFPDVAPAFARWRERGLRIASYSSGSVRAQVLLYRHTQAGDLTPYLEAFFDTTVGAKGERESYERIASALGLHPEVVLFVSDVVTELEAARGAGLATLLSIRPGNRPQDGAVRFDAIHTLDELFPPR